LPAVCVVDAAGNIDMATFVADTEAFKADLIALIPHLRAFSRTLCRDATLAEDLAQDALASAWNARESFEPGTNMKAWLFMILRNGFYSHTRRAWRSSSLDQTYAEETLVAVTSATGGLELDELRRAMNMLPDDQREALILIGAGGCSYEETAAICGTAVGTIKSRVSRARARLAELLANGGLVSDDLPPGAAMDVILDQISRLAA
jgi:RNA polymerase sigma-70 factor (ECF subfamily)